MASCCRFLVDSRGGKSYFHACDPNFDAVKHAFHLLALHVPPRDVYWRSCTAVCRVTHAPQHVG